MLHLTCSGSILISHQRRLNRLEKITSTRRQPESAPKSTWRPECATPAASCGHGARQRKLKAAAYSAEAQASQDLAPPPPPPPPQEQEQQHVAEPTSPGPTRGLIYLLLVALLWGSYTPTLRLAYSLPGPPTPVALTAATGVLELIVLLAALVLGSSSPVSGAKRAAAPAPEQAQQAQQAVQEQQAHQRQEQQQEQQEKQQQAQQEGKPEPVSSAALPGSAVLLLGLPAVVLAGIEIGAYNTVGTFSQVSGLSMTTAARAAFLVQASILFTPILSSLAGSVPARSVWLGSLIAFAGTLIITTDQSGGSTDVAADMALSGADVAAHVASAGADAAAAAAAAGTAGASAAAAGLGLPLGDVLTLAAALCYSAATVRIPVWAVRYRVPAVQLALGKVVALTAVAAAGLALQAAQLAGDGQALDSLWPGWRQPEGWALISWAALGPGALGSVLLVKGQSLVSPTVAQIVFCSVPLCSALLAAVVLPDEPVGTATWLGGAVVAAAGLVASLGRTRGGEQPGAADKRQ